MSQNRQSLSRDPYKWKIEANPAVAGRTTPMLMQIIKISKTPSRFSKKTHILPPQNHVPMIVSTTQQFVFVHIFKTAGTSVKRAIRRYAMPGWQESANSVLKRIGVAQFGPRSRGDHMTASELIGEMELREFNRLFSFAFVRNPWDWELSHYRYICREKQHPSWSQVSSLGGFADYIRWRCDGRFQSQQSFLLHDQKLVVDFVGRFENLESDFKFVCDRIGIQSRLPRLNRTRRSGRIGIFGAGSKKAESTIVDEGPVYRKHYDDTTRQLVQETYADDIQRFGYSF
jgi:hypothetical protein